MTSGHQLPLGLPGLPSVKNLGAMDWNPNGLAVIGNGSDIIVLDSVNMKSLLFMPPEHKSSVNQILWNPHARPFLPEKSERQPRDVISSDTSNTIIMWDVQRCQSVAHFTHSESSRNLLSMKWSTACDTWLKTKLFLLYSGSLFVVLDIATLVYQNISIVDGGPGAADYSIFDFDCDPYCPNFSSSLALLGDNSVYFVSHWDPLKMKQEKMTISSKIVYDNKNISPRPAQAAGEPQSQNKRHSSSSGIRKLVSDIIVGADYPSNQTSGPARGDGSILFHHNLKYHLVVSNSRSIYLINTQFRVILNTFTLERGMSNMVQVILSQKRPVVITLHENGAIALRKYAISGIHTQSIGFETVYTTDPPRLSAKKSEVLGAMLDKTNENRIILHVNDGRFISYKLLRAAIKSEQVVSKVKHLSTPLTPFVATGIDSAIQVDKDSQITGESNDSEESIDQLISTVLEQDASSAKLKLKKTTSPTGILTCLKSRPGSDFIVAGTSLGFVLIIKIEDDGKQRRCAIRKRFAVHCSTPVSGIEFVSDNEILTFANLSFSANPKCEMIILELSTGSSRVLKQDDPNHIGFIRVSPLQQYFLLVYKNGMAACELWDLPRRRLIKTLPSKLPPITTACWREPVEGAKEETFLMTDLGSFLFTFRVDGNRFANATCVKLDTAGNTGGIPVSLVVKGKVTFRADSSGTLVIYDIEKKTASAGVSLGRGPLHKIEAGFGEFDGYFISHFNEQIELWSLSSDVKKIKVLHAGKPFKASDLCWMDGYIATIPRTSGGIKFLPVSADIGQASSTQILVNYPYFLSPRDKCYRLFDVMKDNISNQALLDLFREVCAPEESAFWSVITTSMMSKLEPGWKPPVKGFNLYSENQFYKEVIVRLAQCVWFCDMSKREEVAKLLLFAGESEKAAEILLDTEPSDPVKYIANGMKAALSVGANGLPESTKAVLKITATNLIASGQIDDGLEILCLLSKHSEAAKYMESSNDWSKAILLSKTSLNLKQSQECLGKYGHFLNSQRQVLKSASIYAYVGKYDRAIEVLFGGRKRHLCYLLLIICEKYGIELSNLSSHVKLAIRLDFARFIFECGLYREAIEFCDEIGDEAKDLKSELEILGC